MALRLLAATLVALAVAPAALAQGQPTVTGEVFYLERIALPPTARVTVRLQDTSLADAPAVLIAEQAIDTAGKGPPYAFSLPYDPAQIQDNRTYTVRATITEGDRLVMTSTEVITVITGGNPTSGVRVRVSTVGGGTGGPGGATGPATLPATGGPGAGALLLILGALAVAGGAALRRRV